LLYDSNVELSEEHKMRLIRGIAAGMLHLHKHNIVHRDLAARNILLSPSGDPKISVLFLFLCLFHFIEHVKQIEIDNCHKFILLNRLFVCLGFWNVKNS
jgi:serine/threonine protein kinase